MEPITPHRRSSISASLSKEPNGTIASCYYMPNPVSKRNPMELFWEPLKLDRRGGPAQGLAAGPFQIVPEDPPLAYFTCILKGPGDLVLRCGSIWDALEAAEALAGEVEDDDDDAEEDEDDSLSFLPLRLAAQERVLRKRGLNGTSWKVECADEFGKWWQQPSGGQPDVVAARVGLLMEYGPNLRTPIPRTSEAHVTESFERRAGPDPLRVLYAFDPKQRSSLLIGVHKTGNDRFHEEYVPVADRLYDEHPEEPKKEGLIE